MIELRNPAKSGGIINTNATTYDIFDGVDTVRRYVNGELRQSWTTAVVTPTAGSYMGFGCMTYS